MQKAAETSRFLIDFSSERDFIDSGVTVSRSKLLQHVIGSQLANAASSRQLFNNLSKKLIQFAEHSFGVRDAESLEAASLILQNLPTAEAHRIGQYYQALAVRRSGKIDESLPLLQAVADSAPLAYRARALQTLGAIYHATGRLDEALRLYPDAIRAASPENGRDILTTLLVNLELSCIKSDRGDHRGALADCERLSPLVQIVARQNPLYFYFYHNELAVEFAELGRLAEAEAASAIALAFPFAAAYPEWSDTRDEIAAKRVSATRSAVAVKHRPQCSSSPQAEPQRKPKPVTTFPISCPARNKDSFQRPTITIPARVAIALKATNILDRVLICIGPRAPPAHS